jgi:spore coat protein A
MTQERQQLHRDLPATDVWTYNGTYPGPTIEARLNQPIEVKYVNSLPGTSRRGGHLLQVDQCPHGPNYWQDTARAVVHLHGGHVPARFDGLPEYHIMPGEFDVYQYPNAQDPATLWYHDHALGITRLNVYAGLAAYYILRNPADPVEAQLPSGVYEVPAVIQDRAFFENGELFYPPMLTDAFFGEKILVNGKVWPYLNVNRGKYRIRFLNGSQARTYRLRLENRANPAQIIPFTIIGTDGGFVNAPITANAITMVPAERFDVIVDFAGFPAGTEIVLKNDDLSAQFPVPNAMKFIVTNLPGFTGAIPTNLRPTNPITPIPTNQAPARRFVLERVDKPCADGRILGEWLIKSVDAQGNVIGEQWDDIDTYPMLGTTEIWEFQNLSNMMHPIHVHLVQFQVLDRNGSALQRSPWEVNTFKDTVRVPPQGGVRIIMTFTGFLGKFPFHCHILDHEDHEMMRQYQTVNNPVNCNNNGICGAGEDCVSCPSDCGRVSGAYCGNKLCEIGDGENFDNCPQDCAGKAKGGGAFKCGLGAGYVDCSDTRCTTNGFFCRTEPRVLACCGDALCEGQEQVTAAGFCALDCAAPTVNCSAYTARATCTAEPNCRWNSKTDTCVNR